MVLGSVLRSFVPKANDFFPYGAELICDGFVRFKTYQPISGSIWEWFFVLEFSAPQEVCFILKAVNLALDSAALRAVVRVHSSYGWAELG